jgi:hypothetical protein
MEIILKQGRERLKRLRLIITRNNNENIPIHHIRMFILPFS